MSAVSSMKLPLVSLFMAIPATLGLPEPANLHIRVGGTLESNAPITSFYSIVTWPVQVETSYYASSSITIVRSGLSPNLHNHAATCFQPPLWSVYQVSNAAHCANVTCLAANGFLARSQ